MSNCLTWSQIYIELPAIILTTVIIGGILGGTLVGLMKRR